MNRTYKHPNVFSLVIPLLLLLTACDPKENDMAQASTDESKRGVRVKTMTVEGATFSQKIKLIASAKPGREVTIASEASGRVLKVAFEKGDEVEADVPLLFLDDAKISADLAQAAALRDLAKLDYEKFKTLRKKNAAVSTFDLERARLKLMSAEAAHKSLEVIREKHTIRAPIFGRVVNRNIEKGAIVAPGSPIARIVSVRPIKVSFGVPEAAIADFSIGKEASVYFDAYPDREFTGVISFLSPEVNRGAGTFEGEIELANEEGLLFPEMSAKITMIRKEMSDSILIPQTSILELPDGHAVFVVDKKNTARQKRIKVADYSNEMALIESGVSVSDVLVTVGHRALLDGDLVSIVE